MKIALDADGVLFDFDKSWRLCAERVLSKLLFVANPCYDLGQRYGLRKADVHKVWARTRANMGDPLPDSRKGRYYTFNPSVVASRTITLPSGKVLVHKGQVIDPLTAYPFPWTQSYIVFNPAQPWQVNQVKAWVGMYPNVVLMASELPPSWAAENALVKKLQHPVYGIYPSLAARLGVNRVPALIRPNGHVLSITVPKEPLPGERR